MTVTSIDLEMAQLSDPKSRLLKLTKQLAFVQHKYAQLQGSIANKKAMFVTVPHSMLKFLRCELDQAYEGEFQTDLMAFQFKLKQERHLRNHYEHESELNAQKVAVLEEQCRLLQREANQKTIAIKEIQLEQTLANREYAITINEMDQQLRAQNEQQHRHEGSGTESADTLSVAIQTEEIAVSSEDTCEFVRKMESAVVYDVLMSRDSTSMQTELGANDVLTVDNFADLMIQSRTSDESEGMRCDKAKVVITPRNTLEFEFEHSTPCAVASEPLEQQRLAQTERERVCHDREIGFGRELFTRTRKRMEERKLYDRLKKERMQKKKRARSRKLQKKSEEQKATRFVHARQRSSR